MKKPGSYSVLVESLENRCLFAAPWGATGTIVRQDAAISQFPSITGQGVTVAVVDTGIDYTHPELGGAFGPGHKVKAGWDFVDNDGDPMDTYGHGTNVAGVLAGNGFDINGFHYQGIAPGVQLVALRIAADGSGIADQRMEAALQWIEANYQTYNISIVNISFGSGRYTGPHTNPTLSDEFARLAALGIFISSSAGNEGVGIAGSTGVAYPGADVNVATTGSESATGQISTFTERGPMLDVLAPGDGVWTTTLHSSHGAATGTSFATPFSTGTAALIKQAAPSLKGADILSILHASGDVIRESLAGIGKQIINYYSRLAVDKAIALAIARSSAADPALGTFGVASDVAYDKQGILHLAYYDAAARNIKYASRTSAGTWSATQVIDQTGHDVGSYLSLAIDPTSKPSVAYFDATTADLRYAHFDGTKWGSQKLDSSKSTGLFPSLVFDKDGNVRLAYYRKTSGDLRLFSFDGTGWSRSTIDSSGDVGRFPGIAVSHSGVVGIAYADASRGDLKYASWNGSTWSIATVDQLAGVSDISLAYDPVNNPSISYFNISEADLKFATKNGAWVIETVARKGVQGQYSNLFYDDQNKANIIFYNRTADRLTHLVGSSGAWTSSTLASKAGRFSSVAVTDDETSASYSYWGTKSKKLLVKDLA